jgi:hypothetical protein
MKKTTKGKSTDSNITQQIYNSIDELPLWNFKKINETKDLNYLLKNENTKAKPDELEKAWGHVTDELNKIQGVGDQVQKWVLLQSDLERLYIELLVSNNKSLLTEINIKKRQLERLEKQFEGSGGNFDEQIAAVELFFKFHIDERQTTVRRFFNYINLMRKQSGNGRRQNKI